MTSTLAALTLPTLPTAAARAVAATKIYSGGDTEVRALDDLTVDFTAGRFAAIMGPSGWVKSTLMHQAAVIVAVGALIGVLAAPSPASNAG
jgi:putative ABC transport system ATP-binding protein